MLCVGGPLNAWRLSVPKGLMWFACPREILVDTGSLRPLGTEVVELESLPEIEDFSTTAEWGQLESAGRVDAYVRQSFVSGEHGLVHNLRFQPSGDSPAS